MNFKFLMLVLPLSVIMQLATVKQAAAQDSAAKPAKQKKQEKLKELPDPLSIGWRKNLAIADKLFEQGSIYNGLHYYEAAVTKNPSKTFIYHYLADGNRVLRDYKTANKYYKVLVDMDTAKHADLPDLFFYALTDKYIGNFEKAKLEFELFDRYA
ncbi:MAG TPA: hypothetical protein VG603_06630, partial [Chitinophagales bacterium]|nr:hypothetical protein [Chitinophagales bacterium]